VGGKSVSVILPTYNESRNIVTLIEAVAANIPSGWDYQILVVDDNSPDDTIGAVKLAFESNPRVLTILRTEDRGLAKSIRTGIERSKCERVIVMDADLTHDPAEIPKLLHVGEIYGFVTASRFCAGGRMEDTNHYLFSMAFNWVLRILLRTQVQDNLGGYFTARREMLLRLPLDEIFFGYGDYYYRLLHFVQKFGEAVIELPASYMLRNSGESKSNWGRMLVNYTLGAVKLKWRIRKFKAKK
jgi:dolichol-phosphate mannosyltransferase